MACSGGLFWAVALVVCISLRVALLCSNFRYWGGLWEARAQGLIVRLACSTTTTLQDADVSH